MSLTMAPQILALFPAASGEPLPVEVLRVDALKIHGDPFTPLLL
jgi:hypothetical protein